MRAATPTRTYPLKAFNAVVDSVQDVSPSYRRITFTGPDLESFGVPGPTRDLRIKLLMPVPGHELSRPGDRDGALSAGWYQEWLRVEQPARGIIRSYTVRTLRRGSQATEPGGTELDVEFVLHSTTASTGCPGSDWARAAVPGTQAVIIGPDARNIDADTPLADAGIRWDPSGRRHVLLAGDETAVPAISSILETLPEDIAGQAFLEVPSDGDVRPVTPPPGISVTWLPRERFGSRRGELLQSSIAAALGSPAGTPDLYAWVGAEARTVTSLRRYLVGRLGLDPRRSEFRGYWSLGKAGSGTNGVPVAALP